MLCQRPSVAGAIKWKNRFKNVRVEANCLLASYHLIYEYFTAPELPGSEAKNGPPTVTLPTSMTQCVLFHICILTCSFIFKSSDPRITFVVLPSTGTCIFLTFIGSNINSITQFFEKEKKKHTKRTPPSSKSTLSIRLVLTMQEAGLG